MASDIMVVGSGLFGLTIAERCASELGVEGGTRRGTARACRRKRLQRVGRADGIEVHRYGSHIFHTSNEQVWEYVSRFTEFSNYQHKVFSVSRGRIYAMPVNLSTICTYFDRTLSPGEARYLIEMHAREAVDADALEGKAISSIGGPLYEALIRGYTAKQWQTDPKKLPAEIITRLPVRYTFDSRYFNDTYEGVPLDGYSNWLERMADHPNIEIQLNRDYFSLPSDPIGRIPVVYTGPLDRYFEYSEGVLGWRTLDFDIEHVPVRDYQGSSVINYADVDVPFTRIHEFKYFHPERASFDQDRTVIMGEHSRFAEIGDEPFYPISGLRDRAMLDAYRKLVGQEDGVFFGGRLGTYKYLDMHMAIASALRMFENRIKPYFGSRWDRQLELLSGLVLQPHFVI
ncbi:UDP-galactopyranose mutase [Streptomyces sp. ok210]|uniref:UDP-galactopyranose/dTDP-fucopyranose mutase family protein n=1 Tax=Streptomyces sp. ok210 TaxID=1761905 RepID=UPI003526572E